MMRLAVHEAKDRFGQLMDQAQQEPVTIEKNGRPVAVRLSVEECHRVEQLKLEKFQRDLEAGIVEAERGELLDGDQAFQEVLKD
ncbi:MAG: type II toxin-antitoxin system prevent-host-death family antitoxin [Magnetococcales bacterium]|nr:type II toxin-antitoxin system prevent-host-death family antitoxin [Magnetococcales bacterium]